MPEQLTKHPEVTIDVLRSAAGVRCGGAAAEGWLGGGALGLAAGLALAAAHWRWRRGRQPEGPR